jgi:class 3 adenylate cyclase/tetratricopeptide (TPR) repeat protein
VNCPACHERNPDDAGYCAHCGHHLGPVGAADDVVPGARFCTHCGQRLVHGATDLPVAPGSYTPKHLADRILTSRAALEGERKQVTVVFADVENFTRLGERLDPEELHELMDRVFAILMDVIHRYEGTVNQFTGDGVMALFGAPVALEDHALRAVEAALEIQRMMTAHADEFRARFGSAPMLRIGLNTGRVVVGRIGDDLRMDYTAQGDTVNLAARLQALAEPGTVAMSAATQRLVASAVESANLGPHRVKGKEQPVDVFRPSRLVSRAQRIAAAEGRLISFTGRVSELERLLGMLADARTGRTRAAVLVGEAGIGKSRLLLELRRRTGDIGVRWLVAHCAPWGRTTPYRPIVEVLRGTFGLEEDDSEEAAIGKVEKLLTTLGDDGRAIGPALRWLLGVGDPDAVLATVPASDRKASITRAIDILIQRCAGDVPLVLVVEGCQWLDVPSQEYLAAVASRADLGAVLFVFSCRGDETGTPPAGLPGEIVTLRPLDAAEARELIERLAPELPPDIVALVAERTGGNPLFIEEMTRTVMETGTVHVPPSVEAVLSARIDRLEPGLKAVLQATSVIGRTISRALLERVVDDVHGIGRALESLTRLGFIHPAETGSDVYVCDQPFVLEVTYEGLLHQHRKVLHRRTGDALEELHAHRLTEHIEDLARHLACAEDWPRAIRYHREAGKKAAALCANTQAAQWFERTLELLRRLPDTERQIVEVLLDLARVKFQLGALGEVLALAREAETIAQRLGDEQRIGEVYAYVSNYHYMKGEPDVAIRYGERCLGLGDQSEGSRTRRAARQYLGTSYHVLGEYARAERILTEQTAALEATEWFDRLGPVNLAYVASCGWLAFTLADIGEFARAQDAAARATRAAVRAGHPYAQAIAAAFAGLVHERRGDLDSALPLYETSHQLCAQHQLEVLRNVPAAMLGHACALAGQVDRGLDLLHESMRLTERLDVLAYRSLWTAYLAEALLVAGRSRQAVDTAEHAVELAIHHKERGNHTRALQVLGAASIELGPEGFPRAGEHLRQALEQGETLRMWPLVATTYSSLATLARKQGDRRSAASFLQTAQSMAHELGMRFWWDRAAGT